MRTVTPLLLTACDPIVVVMLLKVSVNVTVPVKAPAETPDETVAVIAMLWFRFGAVLLVVMARVVAGFAETVSTVVEVLGVKAAFEQDAPEVDPA